MNLKINIKSILIVAMSLATAWAIRGQFGHEQGAAWAGAIGGLALVLASGRKDWYNKMALISLASAVGWGVGGMISYGMVVGYGNADNFINAYYGLGMLFVIGGLFGLLGGGLVGLTLDSTSENRVNWGSLIAQMVAGGLIVYYFLIYQIGFKMTPPRSEAWAMCLGAGLAMLWFMAREKRHSAIRVAVFSALGGGIGFSFGNFLQIMGHTYEVEFNMWNVMEYSIGFFGGLGMAYGVFSSTWPKNLPAPKKWENCSALLLVGGLIPLIVFRESLQYHHFIEKYLKEVPNAEVLANYSVIFVLVVLGLMMVLLFSLLRKYNYKRKDILLGYFSLLTAYALLSFILKGLVAGEMESNHPLYIINILALFFMTRKVTTSFFDDHSKELPLKKWAIYVLIFAIFLALLTIIAISLHGDIGGHNRFELN